MSLNVLESRFVAPPDSRRSSAARLGSCETCAVRPLSVCASLDAASLGALAAIGQRVTYASRTSLFREGEPADAVFNVIGGLVRTSRLLPDGRRQVVGFALAGDLVGAALGDAYSLSADAAGPAVVCRFARRGFWELFGRSAGTVRKVYESAMRCLDNAYDQMVLLGGGSAEQKVASFVIGFGARWHPRGGGVLVPLPMSRQDIGDFLGLSISTVSRTLNGFERRRLIVIVPGGVRILDPAGLARLAG